MGRQHVDDLALALVAPLRAEHGDIRSHSVYIVIHDGGETVPPASIRRTRASADTFVPRGAKSSGTGRRCVARRMSTDNAR
jgi:hypothetical protein